MKTATALPHRPEIDGLRAVAVVPVILFHAGFGAFAGGFVGVDVFFVISGYLITSIIAAEQNAGTFSVARFYERRARRILPALFFVMAVSLPVAALLLFPNDRREFSQSVVAAATFWSNVFFARSSGYFDTAAELKPLLHTWSLAIEEQFYVVFPLLLLTVRRLGRPFTIGLLAVAAVASLWMAQASAQTPSTFFSLPARGWELLLGALLALGSRSIRGVVGRAPGSHAVEQAAGAVGLMLIGYAVFAFDRTTPFPGVLALVPTLGTALIILFGHRDTVVGRVLGSRPLVGIGLISYSAYLWHQPLFAFTRQVSTTEVGALRLLGLSAASLALAYVSWRYVEQPFRSPQRIPRRRAVAALAGAAAVLTAAAATAPAWSGSSIAPNVQWESLAARLEAEGDVCTRTPVPGYDGVEACEFGDLAAGRAVAIYGDSHAIALHRELDRALRERGLKEVRVAASGCLPIPHLRSGEDPGVAGIKACEQAFASLLRYLTDHTDTVVVSIRWSYRLYPVPGEVHSLTFTNSDGGAEPSGTGRSVAVTDGYRTGTGLEEKEATLEHLVASLASTGRRVIVVYPVPEIGWNIARVNRNAYLRHRVPLAQLSIDQREFVDRNRFVNRVLDGVAARSNVVPVRPASIFCDTFIAGRCTAQFGGVPYYYDNNHVSEVGARFVVDAVMAQVPER